MFIIQPSESVYKQVLCCLLVFVYYMRLCNIVLEQLCDFDDGWQIRAICFRQILRQVRQILLSRPSKMLPQAFIKFNTGSRWYAYIKTDLVSVQHDETLGRPIKRKTPENTPNK